MRKKCVVITGVTGFLGHELAKKTLASGYKVYGIGRNVLKMQELVKNDNFTPIILDLKNLENLPDYIKEDNVEFLFHLANNGVNGINKSDFRCQIENLKISCELVGIAKRINCKNFIFAGSVDEYQIGEHTDKEFVLPPNSRIYATSKYASEIMCKDLCYGAGINYKGVISPLVYGPGNVTNVLPNAIMRAISCNENISLISAETKFDMIYIDDCIRGYLAVAEFGKNMESYYIGHKEISDIETIAKRICFVLNSNIELNFGAYPDNAPNGVYDSIDLFKAYRDMSFECRTNFDESIIKTYKWLESI